jgi:protease-4
LGGRPENDQGFAKRLFAQEFDDMPKPHFAAGVLASICLIASTGIAKEAPKETAKKKVTLASLKIAGAFPETDTQIGLFSELEQSLTKTISRIKKAAESDQISGIILRLRGPAIGRGKVNELRAAITRARKSGTKVYADLQMATSADYLIASACDEIVITPTGAVVMPGVRAEMMFYKDLLQKVGIQADFLQVGQFKGAAEPYTRSEMSAELRQQLESVIDDTYEQMIQTIAEDRNIEAAKVRELIDEGLFTPQRAKEVGLVDRIAYEGELKEAIQRQQKADSLTVIRNYGKKKTDTDFSGFTGMIKMMNLMMGIEPSSGISRGDKIAVVYAVGVIMTGESQQGLFSGSTLGSSTIVRALRKAAKDDKVKAIVLRVDSPGGSAVASDLIWREIVQIKKPVIASMGDVAASGGYYISMGADEIYAEPATMTGSIGVVGGKLAMGGTLNKIGINTEVISRGKNSGVFSIDKPFSAGEREVMLRLMRETYKQFTTKAAEGRKMKLAQLEKLAEGKVYTGRQAQSHGLVDKLGTLHDALKAAKKAAGLDENQKVDLMILPKPKSLFEQLFEGPTIESKSIVSGLQRVAPELAAPLAEIELIRHLFAEPVNLVMPFRIQIR